MTETKDSEKSLVAMDAEEAASVLSDSPNDLKLRLELENFEGPFEVLLYLIRVQEIDIFDIPILKITEQYLQFLELMHEENLDVAGDFLVMAATLIQIKSKMLIPVEVEEEDEEIEEEDPRLELVEKLLEYRKYRDLTELFGRLEQEQTDVYGRTFRPKIDAVDDDEDDYFEATLYDIIEAFRGVLRYITDDLFHQVQNENSSVDEKIEYIENLLAEQQSVTWTELFRSCKFRDEILCCFLAILELCRMGRIRVHQHGIFEDIRVFPLASSAVG